MTMKHRSIKDSVGKRTPFGMDGKGHVALLVALVAVCATGVALLLAGGCGSEESGGSAEAGPAAGTPEPRTQVTAKAVAPKELRVVLDKSYDDNKDETTDTVTTWLEEREVLSPTDLRNLLDSSWKRDKEGVTQAINPWFYEHSTMDISDIPTLLTKAWDHNAEDTRRTLRDWGDNYGFVDTSDKPALQKNNLIKANDLDQVQQAIKKHHKESYGELIAMMQGIRPAEEMKQVAVEISYAGKSWIDQGYMRFADGDPNFPLERANTVCTLAPANQYDDGIPVTIQYGIDMPEGRVQVQDADFVAVVAKLKDIDPPARGSKDWKRILNLGVVAGSVYLPKL